MIELVSAVEFWGGGSSWVGGWKGIGIESSVAAFSFLAKLGVLRLAYKIALMAGWRAFHRIKRSKLKYFNLTVLYRMESDLVDEEYRIYATNSKQNPDIVAGQGAQYTRIMIRLRCFWKKLGSTRLVIFITKFKLSWFWISNWNSSGTKENGENGQRKDAITNVNIEIEQCLHEHAASRNSHPCRYSLFSNIHWMSFNDCSWGNLLSLALESALPF